MPRRSRRASDDLRQQNFRRPRARSDRAAHRVEARIGEIKDKLSPGQLLDEALSYTKHGGAHFASNLGGQITANPLPAALVGIGLAWLISSTANGTALASVQCRRLRHDDHSYPYARQCRAGSSASVTGPTKSATGGASSKARHGQRYKAQVQRTGRAGGPLHRRGRQDVRRLHR